MGVMWDSARQLDNWTTGQLGLTSAACCALDFKHHSRAVTLPA